MVRRELGLPLLEVAPVSPYDRKIMRLSTATRSWRMASCISFSRLRSAG